MISRRSVDEGIAKVSLVGAGMKTYPGVAAKMFKTLAEAKAGKHSLSIVSLFKKLFGRSGPSPRAGP